MIEGNLWQAWIVWLLPIAGSLLIPLTGRINAKLARGLAVAIGFIAALTAASMIPHVSQGQVFDLKIPAPWLHIHDFHVFVGVLIDPLSVFMANVATWIGVLVLLYSTGYMAREEGLDRYYSLILLFIGAMTGLVMADNFVQLFLFWEIVGVCSYALIGFWYKRPSAVRAGVKAFLVTRVGDVSLLIGILYLFGNVQSFNYMDIHAIITNPNIDPSFMTVPLVLISLGAMGKSAQIPFHVWLPDAMEGPTPVSALIHAATMVKAGVYLLARCSFTLVLPGTVQVANTHLWYLMIIGVGSITAFLSATMALVSTDIKRVLAYSTISQLGYMVAAIGFGTFNGLFASQFHVFSHATFKALLFLCAGSVVHNVATTNMNEMRGLRKYMPVTFMTSIAGVLALSGVPPLSGFWSKDLILGSAISAGYYASVFLLVAAAALTFAYSLRWLYMTFLDQESHVTSETHLHDSPRTMLIPLIALASTSLMGGILEEPLEAYFGIDGIGGLNIPALTLTMLALVVGGASSYAIYFKKSVSLKIFRQGLLGRIQNISSKGYYFNGFYDLVFVEGTFHLIKRVFSPLESHLLVLPQIIGEAGVNFARINKQVDTYFDRLTYLIAEGTMRAGKGLYNSVDVNLDRMVYLIAEGTMRAGKGLYNSVDVSLDRMIYLLAEGTLSQSQRMRKRYTGSVQHFVLAVILGFIVLTILMTITMR